MKDEIQEKIANKWIPRSYGNERSIEEGIIAYKLGIFCGTIKKRKVHQYCWLSITYCLVIPFATKTCGRTYDFMEIARDRYDDSYSSGDYQWNANV